VAKENFDKKRADALLAIYEARLKAIAQAEKDAATAQKDADRLANQLPVLDG